MYEVEDDTYCYPGTTVLKNKLELKNQDQLAAFEAEITAQRASEPLPTGDLGYERYCAIHRHFFQDVYSWAGKPRTVRIAVVSCRSHSSSKSHFGNSLGDKARSLRPSGGQPDQDRRQVLDRRGKKFFGCGEDSLKGIHTRSSASETTTAV